jgi:CubicO group peptidase (beta-lactamase class C family)
LDGMARLLARQKPAWPPGTRHGYHTMSLGLYMQELIRHVDRARRTLGRFFHEEIAVSLGLEFYIGLSREIPDDRLARVKPLSRWRGLLALRHTLPAVTMKMIRPGSLLRRSFLGLDVDPNNRCYLEVEVPAGDGVGTARCHPVDGSRGSVSPPTAETAPTDLCRPTARFVVEINAWALPHLNRLVKQLLGNSVGTDR